MELIQQINLIKDGVSIMIPVVTGFIVLFGGSLGKQWQMAKSFPDSHIPWRIAGVSMCFALISLYICFGTMNICIIASIGEPALIFWIIEAKPHELVLYGKHYLTGAYVTFGVSIAFAVLCYYRILKK